MVAAEYKTNHNFVRRGFSPEVKMSESKVRLQMANIKYNYFRLHALFSVFIWLQHQVRLGIL